MISKAESTPPESELVSRLQQGDSEAGGLLLKRLSPGIRFLLRQRLRDPAAVEDLTQDTLRIVFEKAKSGEIREPKRINGFVLSVVKNLAANHHRRSYSQPETPTDLHSERLIDESPSPLNSLEKLRAAECVRQIIAELPKIRDRQILVRHYISEDDKGQICSDLGLSALHFNRVLFRARQRFKELYLKRFGESEEGLR